jgi:hypothetical protein
MSISARKLSIIKAYMDHVFGSGWSLEQKPMNEVPNYNDLRVPVNGETVLTVMGNEEAYFIDYNRSRYQTSFNDVDNGCTIGKVIKHGDSPARPADGGKGNVLGGNACG